MTVINSQLTKSTILCIINYTIDRFKRRKNMGLVAAKCPECGANINVDESKDAGICEFCGTAFVTEKAINNYNTVIT